MFGLTKHECIISLTVEQPVSLQNKNVIINILYFLFRKEKVTVEDMYIGDKLDIGFDPFTNVSLYTLLLQYNQSKYQIKWEKKKNDKKRKEKY